MRCAVLCLVLMTAFTSQARTWHVRPAPGALVKALTQAQARDTLRVHRGTYVEGPITIDRSVTVIGEGWPVIDGGGRGEVIVVTAAQVTLQGLVVRGTAISDLNDNAAIKCSNAAQVRIIGNRVEGCFFGIYLSNVSHGRVEGNRVIGTAATPEGRRANGIHLWKCDHVDIARNTVMNHRDGIYFEFVTDSRIEHDTSAWNSRYGLHFMFSHRDTYSTNVFHDNGAGVAVMFTREVTMEHNQFLHNRGASAYGLLLKEINDAHIVDNAFEDNTVGIFVDGCNRALIRGNRFSGNGWAVKLFANSTGSSFEGNSFSGNTFDMTTNGELVLSTLNGNYWDRYNGYDLDRDGKGDVPHRPMSVFGLVTERIPYAMVLSRSLLVNLLDQSERVIPTLTPSALEDHAPLMRPPTPGLLAIKHQR